MLQKFDGAVIKRMRKQKGLSQKKLAINAGISNTYLCDIEVGRTNPSIETLLKIAEVLGVEISSFIKNEGEN